MTLEAARVTVPVGTTRPVRPGPRRGAKGVAVEVPPAPQAEAGVGPLLGAPVAVVAPPETAQAPAPSRGPARAGAEPLLGVEAQAGRAAPLFAAVPVPVPRTTPTRGVRVKRVGVRTAAWPAPAVRRRASAPVRVLECRAGSTACPGCAACATVSSSAFGTGP